MPRQLRHHFEGGWYHITTRGMWRKQIFENDRDREHFIELLVVMVERYGILLHAYVLMDNHYHLLIETPEGNASRGRGRGVVAKYSIIEIAWARRFC